VRSSLCAGPLAAVAALLAACGPPAAPPPPSASINPIASVVLDAQTPSVRLRRHLLQSTYVDCEVISAEWSFSTDTPNAGCDPGDGSIPDGGVTHVGPLVRVTLRAASQTADVVECVRAQHDAMCTDGLGELRPCGDDGAVSALGVAGECDIELDAERVDAALAGRVFVTWSLSLESMELP
jgi:hypothetical protein